jgi:hypothetical protein
MIPILSECGGCGEVGRKVFAALIGNRGKGFVDSGGEAHSLKGRRSHMSGNNSQIVSLKSPDRGEVRRLPEASPPALPGRFHRPALGGIAAPASFPLARSPGGGRFTFRRVPRQNCGPTFARKKQKRTS